MVTHIFMQNKNLKQIFIWPVILGVLSAIGLVVALLEEGVLEDASLFGLLVPILVIIYFNWVKK
jgi:hypothetical protein